MIYKVLLRRQIASERSSRSSRRADEVGQSMDNALTTNGASNKQLLQDCSAKWGKGYAITCNIESIAMSVV
jgi:hypothetical protein